MGLGPGCNRLQLACCGAREQAELEARSRGMLVQRDQGEVFVRGERFAQRREEDEVVTNGAPQFRIVLGQRASWPELLARTRETEVLGFDGLFLVDHFYGLFDVMDPTHEAYTMLAALAPFTQSMRLGVLVCGNTYRNPAFLLKQAVTVDHVSGGRGVRVGLPLRQRAGRPLRRGAGDLGSPANRRAHHLRGRALPHPRRPLRAETAATAAYAAARRRLGAAHAAPGRAAR
jgi:hypothetical protein